MFGTYRAQPKNGHGGMVIGVQQFRDPRKLRLDRMLVRPLRGTAATYPINERGPEWSWCPLRVKRGCSRRRKGDRNIFNSGHH